jgi:phospholipid/cholesterol/gamma-HCH transport system substrate-binding protein
MMSTKKGFWKRGVALGAFVVGALGIFLVLYNIAGGVNVGKRYRFTAVVPTALQLTQNADVKQSGVNIGKVTAISNRGATAVIEMAVDPDRGPVHQDARVQVRAKTLVGENYVDVDPGTTGAPALPSGGELPMSRGSASVQLDDILSTFSVQRRVRLRRLLSGLGAGLADSRSVGATVDGVSALLVGGKRGSNALVTEREALARLIPDLSRIFRAVGDRRVMIEQLVRAARRTATDVAAQDAALRAGLRELPPLLTSTRNTTTHLAAVGDHASPVLDDLTVSLQQLTPVARELPSATGPTLAALRSLAGASTPARRLLRSLRRFAGPTTELVPPLDDTLRELRPALAYLAPYSKDIASFFASTGQAVAAGRDATGNMARIQPIFNPTALPVVGDDERRALEALVGSGLARLVTFKGSNNYPKPGTLATPGPLTGGYPQVHPDKKR